MAGTSLFALIDDIAAVLDDIALLTKVAAQKTTGVLGDDLALNAQQVSGVAADRELPVVWAVAKGSARNKCILVPAALAVSAIAPWAVTPLVMAGGVYLCYEGVEKLAHAVLPHGGKGAAHGDGDDAELAAVLADPALDLVAFEQDKVKGAIRTDFVLSAEIITITLGTVANAVFATRLTVLVLIAVVMTVGVYGLVAAIVKLDDAGLYLSRRAGGGVLRRWQRGFGAALVKAAPWLMKALSVAGTVAMFLVGGGILTHGIALLQHGIEALAQGRGAMLAVALPPLLNALTGIAAGTLALLVVNVARRAVRPRSVGEIPQ